MVSAVKAQPFSRNHLLRDASWKAVYDAMAEDDTVHVFGEGAVVKAHYDAPDIKRDFPDRVTTLPISEDGNVNFAVGAALLGVKPIVDIISSDFLYRAMDSICNTAAKLNFVTGREHTIVIRAEFLTGGPTTGQRNEALFCHIPGLRVVVPSTPRDAYGLMREALQEPGVTLYFEDRMVSDAGYFKDGDLETGPPAAFGSLKWRAYRHGATVAILTYGVMRQRVEGLTKYRDPMCIYDLRSLYPLDIPGIDYAAKLTGRVLIIEPDVTYGGVGAEIAAHIAEHVPGTRIKRLGARRETTPAAASLHDRMMPSDEEIIGAIYGSW